MKPMLLHALVASASAFASTRVHTLSSTSRATAPMMSLATESKTAALAVESEPAALDDERLRTVCVALMGQYGKIEDIIDGGATSELDFAGFSALVDSLEVQCTEADRRQIFAMVDTDGSKTIDAAELKDALRASGAIRGMYDDSLRTFGLLVAATLAFDAGIFFTGGATAAFDFLTAYVVEDSLSVDNLFVFLLIFRYFKVPPQLVDICLNYGITGSIVLRGVFIFAGLAAVQAFTPLLLGFSAFLLLSSYTLLSGADDDDELELPPLVTKLLERLPLSNSFDGEKLVTSAEGGGVQLTMLTATLVSIALCDVLFAVDSIPAVLAVSDDPFVVYTSNIAAVVGLRSLYQILSVAVTDLVYLEKAVALVLGFVGLKLGAEVVGVEVSSALSLGVILSTLGGGVLLSLLADQSTKLAFEPKGPAGVFAGIVENGVQELKQAASKLRGR